MYSPLVFMTSSQFVLTNLTDAILPKIPRSGFEEFVVPVFKVLFIVKGNAPHMVQQRAERRIWWMLKDLPFELLECGFDDLCNMRPGVVMKKYGLALLMESFQLNSLIYAM